MTQATCTRVLCMIRSIMHMPTRQEPDWYTNIYPQRSNDEHMAGSWAAQVLLGPSTTRDRQNSRFVDLFVCFCASHGISGRPCLIGLVPDVAAVLRADLPSLGLIHPAKTSFPSSAPQGQSRRAWTDLLENAVQVLGIRFLSLVVP